MKRLAASRPPSPFSAAVNVSQLLVNRTRYCPLPLSPFLSDNIYIVQQDLLHTWACVAMIGSFSAVSHHVTLLDIRFRLLLGYYSIFWLCPLCHEAIICNTRTYVKPETHSYVYNSFCSFDVHALQPSPTITIAVSVNKLIKICDYHCD